MARCCSRRIRHVLLVLIAFIVNTSFANQHSYPEFNSLSIVSVKHDVDNNADVKKIEFQVLGKNIFKDMKIKATKTSTFNNTQCNEDLMKYRIDEIWSNSTVARYVLAVPEDVKDNVYLCLPHTVLNENAYDTYRWYHQGKHIFVDLNYSSIHSRQKKSYQDDPANINSEDFAAAKFAPLKITGLRVEAGKKDPEIGDNGVPELYAKVAYTIRIFGEGFSEKTLITFTEHTAVAGANCFLPIGRVFPVKTETINGSINPYTATVIVTLPAAEEEDAFYVCAGEGNITEITNGTNKASPVQFYHQGSHPWLQIRTFEQALPLWATIVIIVTCLCFSALFSGLNLGLMSLDRTELKILCNTGTPNERKYAKVIQPVRNHGNYLLCSILLGNVFVNSIFTILLDSLTSGVIAVIFSTLAIVIFGEITPQAICSRHGLAVGAKTIYITKLVMLLTAPLAYPVSKLLDCVLGEEIGNVYNRERLKELVKVTTGENDLDKDEVNIISGALELRKKTVSEVMTRIEDVFMLDYDAILDFETVSEIMKSGYSRIPVYEGNRNNIVTMLYIKDLAFVDPDDNTPLKTLCQFYQNPCNFVFEDVTLDVMFRIFKEGNKGHMAFVHRVNSEGEGDPFYETIGLITLEDVIEELIQAEIMDETDVFTDNRTKRRRNADRTKQDFTIFAEKKGENKIRISPQLTLATYQYLSTSVDPFKSDSISETILRRLLKQDVMYHVKKTKDWKNDPSTIIYQQGKAIDYFVLILEGRVEVTVGQENLVFESGPFTFFGIQALTQNVGISIDSPTAPSTIGSLQSLNMDAMLRHTFQPDYTVRACTDVLYMKIKRSLFLAAKRATLMERSQRDTSTTPGDQFDDEVEKLAELSAFDVTPSSSSSSDTACKVQPKFWKRYQESLLHSLEDDGSIGRSSPEPLSKSPQYRINSPIITAPSISQNNTSKTASPRSLASPTSKDVNGPLKKHSVVEDGVITKDANEEEISLLTKK